MRLSYKIAGILFVTLAVLLGGSGWLSIRRERAVLENLMEQRGLSTARLLADFCVETLLIEDYPLLDTFLGAAGSRAGDILSIEVIREGKTVSSYRSYQQDDAAATHFTSSIEFAADGDTEAISLGTIDVLVSGRGTERAIAAKLRQVVLHSVLIFLVVYVALAAAIQLVIVKRIKRLSRHAQRIGEGRLESRLDERSADELGILAGVLNDMAARLLSSRREIERQNEELRSLDQMKSEFLACMSHEIRTPMNGVFGATELLLDNELDSEQRQLVGMIQSSADGLLTIINDILDFSKIEAGMMTLDAAPTRIRALCEDVRGILRVRIDEQGIEMRISVAEDVPACVVLDPVRMRQVLLNLAGNSVKFTKQGYVEIRIGADMRDAGCVELHIEVVDTGIGVAQEKLDQLFQPFMQADASTTREFGGTGLGLSISRQLVELMGGEIEARSEVGKGCVFGFRIVVAVADDCAVDTPAHLLAADVGDRDDSSSVDVVLDGLQLLLVDDNTVNRKIARRLMEKHGCLVDEVTNGLEALEAVQAAPYAAVLMDCHMAVMDGYEATARIRQLGAGYSDLPIIAMTADAMDGAREQCIEAGMSDYLAKPVSLRTLRDVLARALGDGGDSITGDSITAD